MSRATATLLSLTLVLSACGESRLNPFNWFGNSRETVPVENASDNPLIPQNDRGGLFSLRAAREAAAVYRGQPVDRVTSLVIEQVPGGAIVRSEGLSRVQNSYDVRLTLVDAGAESGSLTYRLEAVIPENAIQGGSERQRSVIAAASLTDQQLSGVRVIRVQGLENAREASRR